MRNETFELAIYFINAVYLIKQTPSSSPVVWSSGMTTRCGRVSLGSIPSTANSFFFNFFSGIFLV